MSSEASDAHKIDLAAKKVELEKESEILQGKILEKERDILRLETEQDKEAT
nr:hypothetical protein [Bacillus licheniformis]